VDTVSLATVEAWISDYESGLRSGYPDDRLPSAWEEELRRIDRSSIEGALRYWGTLKAFVFATHQGRGRGTPSEESQTAATAAFEMVARVPVRVTLSSGRTVPITGRSLLALTKMAAHEARLALLQAQQEDATQLYSRLAEARERAVGWRERRQLRRRMRLLEEVIRQTYRQVVHHRERWIAHASTATGAPARPKDSAPPWWREVADEDWARIVLACYEAGPGRYERLGELKQPKGGSERSEDSFGAVTILAAWGVRMKVPAAELMGQDYGQQLAEMRAANPPTLDEALE
jgi:hypothetical protein